jgi:hypothetical protein
MADALPASATAHLVSSHSGCAAAASNLPSFLDIRARFAFAPAIDFTCSEDRRP